MEQQHQWQKHGLIVIVFLAVQYLLGMYANMFVTFPEHAHDGQLWVFAWHQFPIALHIIVGFGLLIGALTLLIRAFRHHDKQWQIASGLGA